MEREKNALLVLLRAGLWEKEPEDLSDFPLSNDSWLKLFQMTRRQSVTGIVYRGVCRLPEELLPSQGLLMQWTVAVDRIEKRNRKMNGVLGELYGMWGTENRPLLLKGQGVASFYEVPLVRECGDIDLYFLDKGKERLAVNTITREGVIVKKCPDQSLFCRWKGIEIEIHPRWIDIYNPCAYRWLQQLEEKSGRPVSLKEAGGPEIEVPSPMLNLLLLDTHILKHALGRGIGLRQLCDMARACYGLHGKVDAEAMKLISHRLGIRKWNKLLHAFLVDYLGLDSKYLPYAEREKDAEPLLEIVWKGGNFGMYPEGKTQEPMNGWRGKMATLCAFLANLRFSGYYAPKETGWLMWNLVVGQFKK